MKQPLFRVIFLCVLLPPLLYILSIQSLERMFDRLYLEKLQDVYIGDTRPLFEGSLGLSEAVSSNISRFIHDQWLVRMGLRLDVIVTTKSGTIVYPALFEDSAAYPHSDDPMKVAAENYELLVQGLVVHIKCTIVYYRPISIAILFFYIGVSFTIIILMIRRNAGRVQLAEIEKNRMIGRLVEREKRSVEILRTLGKKRSELSSRYAELKEELEKEKQKASQTEDGMLDEIITLEEELKRNIDLQASQQQEIEQLKAAIRQYEIERGKGKSKNHKGSSAIRKRFKTLYKNVIIHKKTISGYLTLPEDMKIKCEEVIHQLNENPDQIYIKRKVFSKKSRETVLEVLFAYKGRLYFRRLPDSQIEILTVGTKNTQVKDLEFIDSL